MDTATKHELPAMHFDVTCPAPTTACPNAITKVSVGPYWVYWDTQPPPAQAVGQNATPWDYPGSSASGDLGIPGIDAWGTKITMKTTIACINNTAGTFYAATAVIPPHLNIIDRTKNGATTTEPSNKTISADQIPAQTKFRLTPEFFVWPHGGEKTTVHVTGPGIDFSKDYFDDPATTTSSDSSDISHAFGKDPDAVFTATDVGPLKMWLEFEGAKSVELSYTVIAKASGAGGGGGSTGTGGGGSAPGGGCSTTGLEPFGLAALALLRRRSKR
jgi:hypothetical protein